MKIELSDIAHQYEGAAPGTYALQPQQIEFKDGGAYALLGPSGCGKTTMLNIISGLVRPSMGRVLYDGRDVTELGPAERNIAQMFQFPVVYDSMSVYDNLAFPLRNRARNAIHGRPRFMDLLSNNRARNAIHGRPRFMDLLSNNRARHDGSLDAAAIDKRVREIAEALEIESLLNEQASALGAAHKQIISLGRGLVRQDVAAILLDEPLTVIDPAQKWQLRRKLKEIQSAYGLTTIYVTHDQLEALTFADEILLMQSGQVLQTGAPQELFENPAHPFVGYFIGSPGMNFLSVRREQDRILLGDYSLPVPAAANDTGERALLGIRPEYVELLSGNDSDDALPGTVRMIEDRGADRLLTVRLAITTGDDRGAQSHAEAIDLLVRTSAGPPPAGSRCWLRLPVERTRLYPGEPGDYSEISEDAR